MSDESVHEIQLNGKQLVFMFMTATVAAVVIFLCGVMVGRGVNTTRAEGVTEAAAEATVDPTATVQLPSTPATASGAPVSTQDDLKDLSKPEAKFTVTFELEKFAKALDDSSSRITVSFLRTTKSTHRNTR